MLLTFEASDCEYIMYGAFVFYVKKPEGWLMIYLMAVSWVKWRRGALRPAAGVSARRVCLLRVSVQANKLSTELMGTY